MSWSVSLIGTPQGVNKELNSIAEQMGDGQSKAEFEEALPHIQGLVSLAVAQNVKLVANGHATITDGKKSFGTISVVLECMYGMKWCE